MKWIRGTQGAYFVKNAAEYVHSTYGTEVLIVLSHAALIEEFYSHFVKSAHQEAIVLPRIIALDALEHSFNRPVLSRLEHVDYIRRLVKAFSDKTRTNHSSFSAQLSVAYDLEQCAYARHIHGYEHSHTGSLLDIIQKSYTSIPHDNSYDTHADIYHKTLDSIVESSLPICVINMSSMTPRMQLFVEALNNHRCESIYIHTGDEGHPMLSSDKICEANISYLIEKSVQKEIKSIGIILQKHVGSRIRIVTKSQDIARHIHYYCRYKNISFYDGISHNLAVTDLGQFIRLTIQILCLPFSVESWWSLVKHAYLKQHYSCQYSFEANVLRKGHIWTTVHDFLESMKATPYYSLYASCVHYNEMFTRGQLTFSALASVHKAFIKILPLKEETVTDIFAYYSVWIQSWGDMVFDEPKDFYDAILWLLTNERYSFGSKANLIHILPYDEGYGTKSDVTIVCGMNENVWAKSTNPWAVQCKKESTYREEQDKKMFDFYVNSSEFIYLTRSAYDQDGLTQAVPLLNTFILEKKLEPISFDSSQYIPPKKVAKPAPVYEEKLLKYSISDIQLLMQNPYGYFIHKLLGLQPLLPLAYKETQADFGILVHSILDAMLKGKDIKSIVKEQKFSSRLTERYWLYKLRRISSAVQQRLQGVSTKSEVWGEWTITVKEKCITIYGKTDLLYTDATGVCHIVDYKTGTVPPLSLVKKGLYPQLPLEALMHEKSSCLAYWSFREKGKNVLSVSRLKDVDGLCADAEEGVMSLLSYVLDPEAAFLCHPWGAMDFGLYDHMARVGEWSGE